MLDKAKVKNYGMTVYTAMIKPIPMIARKAILSYWLSVIVTGIIEWTFWKITGRTGKST